MADTPTQSNSNSCNKETPLPWIVHLDMDAFYASVEQADNPELRGKPVMIGGGDRGVISTCSYEARAFGVHSAMPTHQAKSLCPQGIFVYPRMQRYVEVSKEIMKVLATFSPLVEQASIDEAYLDFTGLPASCGDVVEHAQNLQDAVFFAVGLTCSLGIAPVKFLAKIVSDLQKPRGLSIIHHAAMHEFIAALPVHKIPGVGKRTRVILESFSVYTCSDVLRYPKSFWEQKLGKSGEAIFERANGHDPRGIVPYTEPKSESAESTFDVDTKDMEQLAKWLFIHAERVGTNLRKALRKGKTITLKIKFSDFSQITRSKTLEHRTNSSKKIYETALELLKKERLPQKLRLIGVGVSQFKEGPKILKQRSLFEKPEKNKELDTKNMDLEKTMDKVREKFGTTAIVHGKIFNKDEIS